MNAQEKNRPDGGTAPKSEPPKLGRSPVTQPPGEIGGVAGPEPTRFGDWENKGRCTDF
jgi:hypothetical protein